MLGAFSVAEVRFEFFDPVPHEVDRVFFGGGRAPDFIEALVVFPGDFPILDDLVHQAGFPV